MTPPSPRATGPLWTCRCSSINEPRWFSIKVSVATRGLEVPTFTLGHYGYAVGTDAHRSEGSLCVILSEARPLRRYAWTVPFTDAQPRRGLTGSSVTVFSSGFYVETPGAIFVTKLS